VQIVGVSTDGVEANAKFAEEQSFPYPLLCDTERQICLGYGACQDKSDGAAKRISYLIGADGKIELVYGDVAAREHPEQVLADL